MPDALLARAVQPLPVALPNLFKRGSPLTLDRDEHLATIEAIHTGLAGLNYISNEQIATAVFLAYPLERHICLLPRQLARDIRGDNFYSVCGFVLALS